MIKLNGRIEYMDNSFNHMVGVSVFNIRILVGRIAVKEVSVAVRDINKLQNILGVNGCTDFTGVDCKVEVINYEDGNENFNIIGIASTDGTKEYRLDSRLQEG